MNFGMNNRVCVFTLMFWRGWNYEMLFIKKGYVSGYVSEKKILSPTMISSLLNNLLELF